MPLISQKELSVYKILANHGELSASSIARLAHVSRPLAYKILISLIEKKLVIRKDLPGAIATFSPEHPEKLRAKIEEGASEVAREKESFEQLFPSLLSDYGKSMGGPGFRVFTGPSGIRELYSDINKTKSSLKIFRSQLDQSSPLMSGGIGDEVKRQIGHQARLGIRTKAITPRLKTEYDYFSQDKTNLVERRKVSGLDLDSQITLYGDKVAITSFVEPYITTIIQNDAIHQTFEKIFEKFWTIGNP